MFNNRRRREEKRYYKRPYQRLLRPDPLRKRIQQDLDRDLDEDL